MHLRAQIACCELKGDLSPVMLKETFHHSFEIFEITRICTENHAMATESWKHLFEKNNFCHPVTLARKSKSAAGFRLCTTTELTRLAQRMSLTKTGRSNGRHPGVSRKRQKRTEVPSIVA